jgi:two-component system, OmpR family, alkaline phosphatase synthesis response regulator PhoP
LAKEKSKDTILLLEDEPTIRKGIILNLQAEGYHVLDCDDVKSATAILHEYRDKIRLGIFDVMLPGDTDGIAFCRSVRKEGLRFPVIFLTAKSRLEDKLSGFEAGGDDYLTKPFELEELLARIKVRLRKSSGEAVTTKIGAMTLDLVAGSTVTLSGETVRFNERELNILKLFVENRGFPVSRDLILDRVWGTAEFPTNRTIDNYIVKFRKIFEPDPAEPKYFITRHGTGYELSNEE